MNVIIWHNPRCAKSRKTLELLRSRGIEPQILEYLKTPPSREELTEVVQMLSMSPSELMRTGEKVYHELLLAERPLGDDELIAAMVANPVLIERPVVIANGKAAVGRPPEAVLDIL
jgi:arsenate reductase (glutaredoxin)